MTGRIISGSRNSMLQVLLVSGVVGCSTPLDADPSEGVFAISDCRPDALELGGVVWARPRGFEVADVERWMAWCQQRRKDGSVIVVHTEVDHILVYRDAELRSVRSSYSIQGAGTRRWSGVGDDGLAEGILKIYFGGVSGMFYNGEWVGYVAEKQGALRAGRRPRSTTSHRAVDTRSGPTAQD